MAGYLTTDAVEGTLQLLEAAYPTFVTRIPLPEASPQGRTSHAIKIGQRKRTISDMAGPVLTPAFSPDGQTLAAAGGYQTDGAKTTGEMRLLRVK